MAIFKCKMCGGELELHKGMNIAECPYCGTKQTVPYLDDDKKLRLYNRANQYRLDNEFDKAYSAYETIISEKEDEAEAYWGLVLSEYGVEYVEDPATKKRIPTCHRTLVKSVTSNENFKLACQFAESESRMMYEDEAEELDSLQKKILNASAKEDPYDVFICYKETDDNGERTADSVLAQEIYNELTRSGLRVFFSRISLEDKLGKDYEPCIYAALTSAKVMLMVTTDSDYCNAVWVKNEWKRYIDFMKTDREKVLIPVYKDISPYTLPDEFAKLQAQDMSKLGAIQDLAHGVEKIVGKGNGSQSGLGQKEKDLLSNLEKSQKRKAILTKIALVFAAFFVLMVCANELFRNTIFFNDSGIAITYNEAIHIRSIPIRVNMLGGAFLLMLATGILSNLIGGIKSKLASAIYICLLFMISMAFIVFSVFNIFPSLFMILIYLFTFILAVIFFFMAFGSRKTFLFTIMPIIVIMVFVDIFIFINMPVRENGKNTNNNQIKITTNELNIRETANKNGKKIGYAYKGEYYDIVDIKYASDEKWYLIENGYGISGYVSDSYVKYISTEGKLFQSTVRDTATKQIEILNNRTKLRKGAGNSHKIIGKLYKGEIYNIIDISYTSGKVWYKIELSDGTNGYVSQDSVKYLPSNDEKQQSNGRNPNVTQIQITTEYINIRHSPSLDGDVLGRVYKDEYYNILGTTQEDGYTWYKIKTSTDILGYVASNDSVKYVTILSAK
jgi:uncharacterized protein YgiM (DUF1202 family)